MASLAFSPNLYFDKKKYICCPFKKANIRTVYVMHICSFHFFFQFEEVHISLYDFKFNQYLSDAYKKKKQKKQQTNKKNEQTFGLDILLNHFDFSFIFFFN